MEGLMRKATIKTRISAIILCCALAGGAAALIAGSASARRAVIRTAGRLPADHGPWPWQAATGPPVHAVSAVPNQADSGFVTLTIDEGAITGVGAGTISLREGTKQATYGTPSLTIPPGSDITLNGESVSLEKLAVGDSAVVRSSPEGTMVSAWDRSSSTSGVWPADRGGAHAWSGHEHANGYPGRSWGPPSGPPSDAPGEGPGAW
jgi:hypothetical protein